MPKLHGKQWPDGFEIFSPLTNSLEPGSCLIIATYGLSSVEEMLPVVKAIKDQSVAVYLLVGYSKKSHDPAEMLNKINEYRKLNWKVRVLPNCHLKIWITFPPKCSTSGRARAWIGSCNFVRSTLINYMIDCQTGEAMPLVVHYWRQAASISRTTNLALVPQASIRHEVDPVFINFQQTLIKEPLDV